MRTGAAVTLALLCLLAGCLGVPAPQGTDGPANTTTERPTTDPFPETMSSTARTTTRTASTATPDGTTTATAKPTETVRATFLVDGGENVTVTLEIADEPAERREGLMYRESLPKNHGMVFVYPDPAPRSFWMKNTYVPLDMLFIGPDNRVLNVEHASVQPDAPDSELERYRSEGYAQYVVELNRGFANRTGVDPGTRIVFHDSLHDRDEG